ncbi:uncharacterized protein C630.12 isoform X2 [Selaginella moellendorffii]|uniref:uncharacterized protein C630.12 isoform X2 n=1 Tax=Selaginella moellendorffii TaxID=88036 RepID=UPI000D1CE218|nr:uncharacterized protein C630.12 isoform X2 [Selaginella moellendorffii]XP_024527228.1 uncharacterized protein C630.12 isoform X2 [Selaginella moellendorffii]XP_024527229.1 uncharacterized protein C630.12 isoform X2 [Selaginella moellendorffii]|eukprot:XP_024527227.1 uncharacterized protein C630.12 isoform X2 [Selaginella moellendorffii]
MRSLWTLTVFLGGLWIASLLYGELLAFWIPRWSCSWPNLEQKFASTKLPPGERPLRIVLIADPQLTDRTSYGMDPRSLLLKIIQFYSDIYMRRAFRSSVLGLEPDEILFLGDYFDGGPYLADDEWEESWKRFEHIFDQTQRGLKSRKKIPTYYLCGNHDLGYHEVFSQKPQIAQRYQKKFGETDFIHNIGSLDFVFVNSQALDGSRADPFTNASWSFVEKVASSDRAARPMVLMTHIPLFRPDNTPCGSDRASDVINQRLRRTNWSPGRVTYQNYLTDGTSQKLLNLTKPVMVFSGHDHDQCKIVHATPEGFYPEYTVGTFSWQQGNIYPSFMMLSVPRSSSAMTDTIISESLCFLPAQDFNYAWYGVLFVISVLALFFWPSQGIDLWQSFRSLYDALKAGSEGVKAKDEDAEWEMLWDAEGGMHLVKKSLPQTSVSSSQGSERRGNVIQRATAKSKASTVPDEVTDTDTSSNLSPSSRNRFRRRLVQMVGPLTVLATVNFSLYMMLVMKDWT